MNKLAVLAFSLLIFLSFMMWYLASGSLNDYLKSQVILQGEYYTGQTTHTNFVNFTANTGTGIFKELSIEGGNNSAIDKLLVIDDLSIELSQSNENKQGSRAPLINQTVDGKLPFSLIMIDKISINKLVINIDHNLSPTSNIENITQHIILKLATDYPQDYPEISAQRYAQANPELNADDYADSHPNSESIKAQEKKIKKRSKPQQRFNIISIVIKTLEVNTFKDGIQRTQLKNNIEFIDVADKRHLVGNQLGGEILLSLFSLALEPSLVQSGS